MITRFKAHVPGLLSSAGTGKQQHHEIYEQEDMLHGGGEQASSARTFRTSVESSRPIRAHEIYTRRPSPMTSTSASAGHRRKDGDVSEEGDRRIPAGLPGKATGSGTKRWGPIRP
ncbi:uncharacterized protein N7458_002224 [Penicillium daleae]|uniref:Uncharacterized protein n=1 Tax=Penicillium daleae TaxID=63821 RepID=A0AAD6G6Z0_9EURO|nr:uncharacterized protein N7458_002224 [Penicillium daleae]KAJ5460672.1 hypothetical protein N7458_002224 [Penicillium daleae]